MNNLQTSSKKILENCKSEVVSLKHSICEPTSFPEDKLGATDYYYWRYLDFKKRYPDSDPPNYYLHYGHKYVLRFSKETITKLSNKGKKWVEQTRNNLQVAIEQELKENPDLEVKNNGKDFNEFVFNSHLEAYWKSGIYKLEIQDLTEIFSSLKKYDLWTTSTFKLANRMLSKLTLGGIRNEKIAIVALLNRFLKLNLIVVISK